MDCESILNEVKTIDFAFGAVYNKDCYILVIHLDSDSRYQNLKI